MKIQKYYYLIAILLIGFLFCSTLTKPNLSAKTFSIETDTLLKSSSNGEFIIYLDGIKVNEYTNGSQTSSSICRLSDDMVAIIWQGEGSGDDEGVFASILNVTTGENLTAEFRVNDFTSGSQNNPSACVLSNETFAITWQGSGVGDNDGTYARVFNATTGTSMTSVFRANSYTTGSQILPSICALSNEAFVITWYGTGVSDNFGIYASIFNATTGTNMTSEFRVNSYTSGEQSYPFISALSYETFAIIWSGIGAGDDSGVFFSVFYQGSVNPSPEDRDNDGPLNDFGFYLFLFIIISLSIVIAIVAGSIYSVKKKKYTMANNSLQTKSKILSGNRISKASPPLKTIDTPQHKKKTQSASSLPTLGLSEEEQLELKHTESEVNVEKREVICVVHKSSIKGAIYMCPKCDTYYCFKCARMLSERGENCWVCNAEISLRE